MYDEAVRAYYDSDEAAMNEKTARRKRRRAKARLHNPKAVRAHREPAGRTGSGTFDRCTPGRARGYTTHTPNPPPSLPPWWR